MAGTSPAMTKREHLFLGVALAVHALNHVDDRDEPWDKPGHDGVG
jgi:hypothetical protein